MGDIIERIQQKIDRNAALVDQKMYAYSGHDMTIASVLIGLGIKLAAVPGYASALMLELHKDLGGNDYFLRLFYRNDTESDDVYELDIPECSQPCSFGQISRKLKATLIPESWEAECHLIPNDADSFPYLLCKF
jgi:lysosomal acid phosphatase